MMYLVLKIDIHGDVDQTGLDRLRTQLGLKKQGRLTDDWDETFGKRLIQYPDGRSTKIALYRHSTDGSWSVNVSTTQPDPSDDEVTELRAELVSGVTAAGFGRDPCLRETASPFLAAAARRAEQRQLKGGADLPLRQKEPQL